MENSNNYIMCRLCHVTTEKMVPLTQKLIYMIQMCLSIHYLITSQLPSNICQNCVDLVNSVSEYRKTILYKELTLLKSARYSVTNQPERFYLSLNKHIQINSVTGELPNHNMKDVIDVEIIDIATDDSNSNHTTDSVLCEEINAQIDQRNEISKMNISKTYVIDENQNSKDVTPTAVSINEDSVDKESRNMRSLDTVQLDAQNPQGDQNASMKSNDLDAPELKKKVEFTTQNFDNEKHPRMIEIKTTITRVDDLSNSDKGQDLTVESSIPDVSGHIEDLTVESNNSNLSGNIEDLAVESNNPVESGKLGDLAVETNNPDVSGNIEEPNADLNENDVPNIPKVETLTPIKAETNDTADTVIKIHMDTSNNDEIEGQLESDDITRNLLCLTCLQEFESPKQLSHHYKTVELSKVIKEKSKSKESNIYKAETNDKGKIVYKCGVCPKVLRHKGAVIRHSQIHKVDRPFLCNLCGRAYKSVQDIVRHGVVHSGYHFVCPHGCGYTTVHLNAMREHVKRHRNDFKYKCEKCGKRFQVKTWFEQHKNVHENVRPFVCDLCDCSFSMARYLTAHRANVHPQTSTVNRYKCTHCSLPCDSRNSLLMHMQQMHDMKTDSLCDVCGLLVPNNQKLALHKRIHQVSKTFCCRFCKKMFKKKDHQRVHEKIHTGERLKCNNCPKSFTQRCSLRRHIKRYNH